jgi:hypothetical protein
MGIIDLGDIEPDICREGLQALGGEELPDISGSRWV